MYYFLSQYGSIALQKRDLIGTDEEIAIKQWEKANEQEPYELYRLNGQILESYNDSCILHWKEWKEVCKVWVVVRYKPSFTFPETIIRDDGIFTSIEETEEFTRKHIGTWKLYDFNSLQYKMAESIRLKEEELKEMRLLGEIPF